MRSRVLKTTVLAAVAASVWTHMPQAALRLRRLSLKCWFMGHDDWIRRTPDRLYLECFECGRETQGWATGKSHRTDGAAVCIDNARAINQSGVCQSVAGITVAEKNRAFGSALPVGGTSRFGTNLQGWQGQFRGQSRRTIGRRVSRDLVYT